MERGREIFIKLENLDEVVDLMKEIRLREESLKQKFAKYDEINSKENKIFENWSSNLDEVSKRLDYVTL